MKTEFSPYLKNIAVGLKELIAALSKHYDYVSVLSTDSVGFQVVVSQRNKNINGDTLMAERGNVVRVYKDGLYSEYSFNRFDSSKATEAAEHIKTVLDKQLAVPL